MIIVSHITAILEAMRQDSNSPLMSWQYNSPSRANVENDYTNTPTAVAYCITDWYASSNIVRERSSVVVGFLTSQPAIDFDGLANEALIDSMKDVAFDFVSRIKTAGILELTDDEIKIRSIYDLDDRNLTGVFLEINLKEIQGECLKNYETE